MDAWRFRRELEDGKLIKWSSDRKRTSLTVHRAETVWADSQVDEGCQKNPITNDAVRLTYNAGFSLIQLHIPTSTIGLSLYARERTVSSVSLARAVWARRMSVLLSDAAFVRTKERLFCVRLETCANDG